jgi:hypothetical protein
MSQPASEEGTGSGSLDQAMCDAAAQGDLNSVRRLHQSGARLDVHDSEPLCRAAAVGHLELVRYLHQQGGNISARGDEPLCRAAAAGHLELVIYLHQQGVDIGARGNEPLRRAAAGGHYTVVQYLHEAGAATKLLSTEALHTIEQMKQELSAAPTVYHSSMFWSHEASMSGC